MGNMPKNPEQRHYQRLYEELPVNIQVDGESIHTTAQNISCGGMFLPTVKSAVTADQKIIAFINLPDELKPIRMAGRIARVTSHSTTEVEVAVQFSGLYDDNHLAIDKYIKHKTMN
jgi:hypothetical protein